ncbi:rubredoxin-like domain-containing protein [Thermodesulfobacteriota bacterium]
MKPEIQDENMALTFTALSVAAAQNDMYAKKARKEGKQQLANLLNAIAGSERIEARRALVYLRGKIGTGNDFLSRLMGRKKNDFETRFPELEKLYAEKSRGHEPETFSRYARVAENHHELLSDLYKQDPDTRHVYYVCQVCGYIATDDIPGNCPICNAVDKKFKTSED